MMSNVTRTIFLWCIAIATTAVSALAQEYVKPVVSVGEFSGSAQFSAGEVAFLRSDVMRQLRASGRVVLVDMQNREELEQLIEASKDQEALRSANDAETFQRLVSQYAVKGKLLTLDGSSSKDSKGKISYKTSIKYTITVFETKTGTTVYSHQFESTPTYNSSREEGRQTAVSRCNENLISLIETCWPLTGHILKVEETKKDKAESVYVDLGSNHGLTKDTEAIRLRDNSTFMSVYLREDVAGEEILTEIGSLKVDKIVSPNRTLCSVRKGKKEILKAIQAGQELIVKTRPAHSFF